MLYCTIWKQKLATAFTDYDADADIDATSQVAVALSFNQVNRPVESKRFV